VRWTRAIDYAASCSCGTISRYAIRVQWVPSPEVPEPMAPGSREIMVEEDINMYKFTDLECWRDYRFTVRAENIAGWGDWSDPSSVVCMPLPVPEAPPQPSLRRATHHAAVIQWQHPELGPTGAAIESYRFRFTTSKDWKSDVGEVGSVPCNVTQYTIDGLRAGQTYIFQVAAVNKYGMGVWSKSSIPLRTAEPSVPSKTKDLTVPHVYNSFIMLQWTPAEANGFEVTQYELRHSLSPDMTHAVQVNSPVKMQGDFQTCAIHHLEKGRTYYFQVAAHNEMGMSDWSEPALVSMEARQQALTAG